jgi:hypothetical protein
MTAMSLALLNCSPTVNSGLPECPRNRRQEQRKGGRRERARLARLGPWLRPGPAQASRSGKGEGEGVAWPRP